ncbi:MAG: hypothetical protein J6X65_09640 [Bacteroidales bacterium]|nr:hypothetical protein [Bacteroidales bacterium]
MSLFFEQSQRKEKESRYFRGKLSVRCYLPAGVPRVAVWRIPTPDCASRSVSLVWGY